MQTNATPKLDLDKMELSFRMDAAELRALARHAGVSASQLYGCSKLALIIVITAARKRKAENFVRTIALMRRESAVAA